jgi:hypothetical protein
VWRRLRKKKKKKNRERQNRKTRRGIRGIFGTSKKTARSPEVDKKPRREMEKILEKLEEMKVEIRGGKEAVKREPRSQERNRTTKGRI